MPDQGKKKLFGGMKIKGPAAKQEGSKPVSNNQPEDKPQLQEKQESTVQSKVSPDQATEKSSQSAKEQTSHIKGRQTEETSIQRQNSKVQKPEESKSIQKHLHNDKQSNSDSDPKSFNDPQKQSSDAEIDNKQNLVSAEHKKTRSERNYSPQKSQGHDFPQKEVREDRSEVLQVREKDENEFRKRKQSSGVTVTAKNNPFLNQIKKNTTVMSTRKQSNNIVSNAQTINKKTETRTEGVTQTKTQQQKTQILQELCESHKRILQNFQHKKQTKQEIINLSITISQLRQEQSVLANKQNHYIAEEQYDMADKLQQQIEQLSEKVSEEEIELSCLQEGFYKLEYETLNIIKGHYEHLRRLSRKIKLVGIEIEEDSASWVRKQDEVIENERTLNNNEKKKISRIKADIQSQEQQLQQYETGFYEDLNARRGPLEAELREQEANKRAYKEEIKELERKLAEKKALLKGAISNIESINQKIQEVDQNFEEEKVKLDERKSNLSNLKTEKQELSVKLSAMEEKVQKLEEFKRLEVARSAKQKGLLEELSSKLEEECSENQTQDIIETKKVKIDSFILSSKQLTEFEEKHKSEKEKVKELELEKTTLQASVTKYEERIKELKKAIPRLEQEQKQMSAVKNFKGAGMKKNQIKEHTEEITHIKKEIENSFAQEARIESSISDMLVAQQQYLEEQNEIRKNLAVNQYKVGMEKIAEISSEMAWLQQLSQLEFPGGSALKEQYMTALSDELASIKEEVDYIADEYNLEKGGQDSQKKQDGKKPSQNITHQKQKVSELEESQHRDQSSPNSQQNNEEQSLSGDIKEDTNSEVSQKKKVEFNQQQKHKRNQSDEQNESGQAQQQKVQESQNQEKGQVSIDNEQVGQGEQGYVPLSLD